MTNYIVLDQDDIRKINEDRLVVSVDRDDVMTVICSEKAFEEHKRSWNLEEGEDFINVTKGE